MTADLAPRPLADLEMDSVLAVEQAMGERALGLKPWTTGEYLDRVEHVHAMYAIRREWLRTHPQEAL
jgi:hypothetical protein